MPKITTNLGKELYFVKLPNFLSVDCKPFDPETYEDEIEDEENPDEEGRSLINWWLFRPKRSFYFPLFKYVRRYGFYYVTSFNGSFRQGKVEA